MKDFAGLKAEIQTMPGMPTKSKSLPGMVATAAVKALEQASIAGTSQMPCLELCRDAVRPNRSHEDHAI
eukprot:6039278-Prorocentrum_lima.AAC.1